MKQPWQIWRDRRGQLSALRIATLALLIWPVVLAAYAFLTTGFGARPLNDVIHRAGYWALIFILLSLAVTPLRRIARFGSLIDVRRMIGVGAFCYAFTHICLYVADQSYDIGKVASEIVLRLYLTIGFTALIGLAALAATSTDAMVKRLGGLRWRRLHQAVYVIALLALIHYFQQTKADVSVPVFTAGIFGWLMAYRAMSAWSGGELSAAMLLVLSLVAAILTFAGEAIGIGIAYHVSPMRILSTAFDFDAGIRPGWLVLAAGLAVVIVDLAATYWRGGRVPARKPAQA
ncbi:MAG TPA: protein-methionine-sulfoxide reductase heme-binding subunit MsrQ [Pseudorhodoplanes sp.]|jgi:sulfoxide reductase heme-binding subunit YedZ|nr:protein-methionine-sulfoxide reductase heme-binding subunit MsrQ [Pseudorhodoplanes sp.]